METILAKDVFQVPPPGTHPTWEQYAQLSDILKDQEWNERNGNIFIWGPGTNIPEDGEVAEAAVAEPGDWIVKEADGEVNVYTDADFQGWYQVV